MANVLLDQDKDSVSEGSLSEGKSLRNLAKRAVSQDPEKLTKTLFDERGKPRLRYAQQYFLESTRGIPSFDELRDFYESWRDFDEFLVLQKQTAKGGEVLRKNVAVKCSKRGNDVYSHRLKRSLGFLGDMADVRFFEPGDFRVDQVVKTGILWVTLTFDPSRCSLQEAWGGTRVSKVHRRGRKKDESYLAHADGCRCISCEWNRFMTRLRQEYGRISAVRFYEAFPGEEGSAWGYPHVHCVLFFEDCEFTVFPHLELNDKTGRYELKYRIERDQRDELEKTGRYPAFIDVQALSSMKAVRSYCLKYVQRKYVDSGDRRANLNQALMWLFSKRSFSVSGEFREKFSEFIDGLHNSKRILSVQVDLGGDPVSESVVWVYLGVFSSAELGLDGLGWSEIVPQRVVRSLKLSRVFVVGSQG